MISALEFLKFEICVVNSFKKKENIKADGFILPGVGTFPSGMKKLKDNNLDLLIHNLIDAEIPGMEFTWYATIREFGFECNTKKKD